MRMGFRLNAPHQRDDPRAQRVKERIKLTDAAALFGVVQKRVVICRLFLFTQIERLMRVGNDLGQRTAEHGKVRRLLCLQPLGVGAVVGKAHLIVQLRRNVFLFFPRLIQMFNNLFLHLCQSVAVRVQFRYKLGIALGVREPEIAVRQNGHIGPRLLHAVLRRAALHVKFQLAYSTGVDIGFVEQLAQPVKFLLICHRDPSFSFIVPRFVCGRKTRALRNMDGICYNPNRVLY